jgi:3-hydroxybutyryl-CoA dehydrogenase
MQIVVLAEDEQWEVLKNIGQSIDWKRVENIQDFLQVSNPTAFFNLLCNSADEDYSNINVPIFVNSVVKTLFDIKAKSNVIRINAWKGFLEKEIWEIAGEVSPVIVEIFQKLHKKYIVVKDEPGFVTARTIAMIINEAYFATTDQISTEAEIDLAMKLGTNYPYGPFEWAQIIGIKNIVMLLQKLLENDNRYEIAPALLAINKI